MVTPLSIQYCKCCWVKLSHGDAEAGIQWIFKKLGNVSFGDITPGWMAKVAGENVL